MSTFVAHHTHALIAAAVPSSSQSATPTEPNEHLGPLFLSLQPPISLERAQEAINALRQVETAQLAASSAEQNDETRALQYAILGRISVALYAHALQIHLEEATHAEEEAEWWFEVERSQLNAAEFLLQSMPPDSPARALHNY
jgi:nuclear control of ATPase protein 2